MRDVQRRDVRPNHGLVELRRLPSGDVLGVVAVRVQPLPRGHVRFDNGELKLLRLRPWLLRGLLRPIVHALPGWDVPSKYGCRRLQRVPRGLLFHAFGHFGNALRHRDLPAGF